MDKGEDGESQEEVEAGGVDERKLKQGEFRGEEMGGRDLKNMGVPRR